MSSITSTGLGSGLDINSIVTAIVDAEKDPALAKMTQEAGEATAMISAYGLLNSELSSFKSSYKDLGYNSSFAAATSTSSDSAILDATLGFGAEAGQWEFEVKQRAQSHTLVSAVDNAFTEVTDAVGEGIIKLSYGNYSADGSTFTADPDKAFETINISNTIDPITGKSNNSLEGLRDAINDKESNYSVSASIINDGSNYRLILTSKETGEQSAVELTATDLLGAAIPAGTGLDRFTFSAASKNMTQTVVAQDAEIDMNGISITSETNDVTSVIEGVTLNLNGAEVGKKVSLTIDSDTSKVEDQINAFLENYNNTITKMNELTVFNGVGAVGNGVLNGDSTIRNIQNMMRGVLNTTVDHIEGSIHSFADLGMLTQRDGTLELDKTKFADALKNDLSGVADFFTATGAATDSQISFDSNNSATKPGTYGVEVTQLATQGALAATVGPGLVMDDTNNSFQIRVDGYESSSIDLNIGTYSSIDELVLDLQSKINSDSNFMDNGISVKIINDAGKLSISSNKYGSSSTVAFTTTDANFTTNLGFSGSSSVNGLNVAGTIDGNVATGSGQYLSSDSGDSEGIKLLIEGGALGSRGNVTYAEGMTKVMNDLLDGIIDKNISESSGDIESSQGIVDGKIDSFYKKISALEEQEKTLTLRMDKYETRLYKDFNAMDIAVSNMNNTMSYLQSALDALPGYTRDK
ncbi:MAG: flagellar hook-associated protein 2 [Oleiphilaceae bacterium]|jgi:flagellar hook-associated protein 2